MSQCATFRSKTEQSGFAIVSAIFLLVALAALGAFMVTFSNTQHLTSAQDIQGSRAYWAAKGGVQWAAGRIVAASPANAAAAAAACAGANGNPAFGNGFAVAVTCQSNVYIEGTIERHIYWITATASAGGVVGGTAYVERQVQAFIETCVPNDACG